jgi:hypothetical protein
MHWEKDGTEDSILIKGPTLESICEQAEKIRAARGLSINDCWSEEVTERCS